MNKKTTKKTTETVNLSAEYDSKREQNVLLEDINKSVKAIAEGHQVLIDGQEKISAELETVKFAVMENSRDIKILKQGQKDLKAGQENLEARFNKVETKLDKVETRIDRVETKIDKVTENHEHRIDRLEAVIS